MNEFSDTTETGTDLQAIDKMAAANRRITDELSKAIVGQKSVIEELLIAMFALRCLSGALLGGLAGHLVTEALYRTGVLSGLGIDRARRAHV